ncbi:NADH dehydrogenase I, chain E [gamma proteobacterium HdN1]|nr:NADH dehydrogenase I, chain E [gamma proteobacterium HdN1]
MNKIILTQRGAPYEMAAEDRAEIEHSLHHYDDPRAASIDALKVIQRRHGWVPNNAIREIALILQIPDSDVEGVATFYNRIYRSPVGRHVITVCDSIGCFLTGFEEVYAALQQRLGIKPGQTTSDNRFTLIPTCCLGACDRGPVLMINDDTYFNLTVDQLDALLEKYA